MRWIPALCVLLLLAACATTPPIQEMAAARSAIASAKALPDGNYRAKKTLKSAEKALSEAAQAINQQHFEQARILALKAKRKAQRAAKLKQKAAHGAKKPK